MAKKNKSGQYRIDLGPVPPDLDPMTSEKDISFPLHAYMPASTCPSCGRKVRPGCPELCLPVKIIIDQQTGKITREE